jgi:hypothetical protein
MRLVFEGGGIPAFWYGLGYGMTFLKNETPTFMAGYSAGALVATLLTCSNVTIETIVDLYKNMPLGTRFGGMANFVTTTMEKALPEDAHVYANDYVGVILCDPNNNSKCRMVSKWDSRDDLIRCLVASCYIPCLAGCMRLSDETYDCRDAVFSTDLETFISDFDQIVGRSIPNKSGFLCFCENVAVVSHDSTFIFMEEGEIDYKKKKSVNQIIHQIVSKEDWC